MLHFLAGGNDGGVDGRFTFVIGGNLVAFLQQPDGGLAFLALRLFIKGGEHLFQFFNLALGFFHMVQAYFPLTHRPLRPSPFLEAP